MRILLTLPRPLFPPDTGGKIRSLNIFQRLAKSAEVHALSFADAMLDADAIHQMSSIFASYTPVYWHEPMRRTVTFYRDVLVSQFGSFPYFLSKFNDLRFRLAVQELITCKPFDLLICDFLHTGTPLASLDFRPKILFQHNVEFLLRRRKREVERRPVHKFVLRREWQKTQAIEGAVCRSFDHVLTVSGEDQLALKREFGIDHSSVVPTGVDTDYFRPVDCPPIPARLVFIGSMDWDPNEDGVLWFLRQIFPQIRNAVPNTSFSVVGRNPSSTLRAIAAGTPGVEITGSVPDVRPHLASAEVVVVPLRVGGGTRIKIPEAMAMRKAVVSTTIGAEGLPFRSGHDICTAGKPDDFANVIIELLKNSSLRAKIAANARREVVRNCSWQSAVDALMQTLREFARSADQAEVVH